MSLSPLVSSPPSPPQPPGYKIEFSDDEKAPRVQLKYPHGVTGPQPQYNPLAQPPAAPVPSIVPQQPHPAASLPGE